MDAAIGTAIQVIRTLLEIRQQLKDNAKDCQSLCDRVQYFSPKLDELQSNSSSDLLVVVEALKSLLEEIHIFVVNYLPQQNEPSNTFLRRCAKKAARVVVNACNSKADKEKIVNFNTQIDRLLLDLNVVQTIDFEQRRAASMEDLEASMHQLSRDLMSDLEEIRNMPSELRAVLEELKANSDNNNVTAAIDQLVNKVNVNNKVTTTELRLLKTAITNLQQRVETEIAEKYDCINDSINEVKGMIVQLRGASDIANTDLIARLEALDRRVTAGVPIESDSLDTLCTMVSTENQVIVNEIRSKFDGVQLLHHVVIARVEEVHENVQNILDRVNNIQSAVEEIRSNVRRTTLSPSPTVSNKIPLESLDPDQANGLLVLLGCPPDMEMYIRQSGVTEFNDFDGFYLGGVTEIHHLRELGGDGLRELSDPKINSMINQ